MSEDKIWKIIGQLGIVLLVMVLVYLLLKIVGIVQSLTLEEVLTTAVFGALFYVGYSYRAIEEIKELRNSLKGIEKRLSQLEKHKV